MLAAALAGFALATFFLAAGAFFFFTPAFSAASASARNSLRFTTLRPIESATPRIWNKFRPMARPIPQARPPPDSNLLSRYHTGSAFWLPLRHCIVDTPRGKFSAGRCQPRACGTDCDASKRRTLHEPPEHRFAVACPHCGVGLKVGESDLGTQRDCPKCGAGFMLPTRTEALRLAEAKRLARQQFGFLCRLCGSRLYAMPAQIGKKMKCPDCHAINIISPPPPKATATMIQPGEEYDLALADETPNDRPNEPRQADELFNFPCGVCQTMQSVPRSWVGRQLACPDCGTRLVVPFPPPTRVKVNVVAKDPGFTLGARCRLRNNKLSTSIS